jgi:hypothetical protein
MLQSSLFDGVAFDPFAFGSPKPLIVRVQSLPAKSYFAEHSHTWNQSNGVSKAHDPARPPVSRLTTPSFQ